MQTSKAYSEPSCLTVPMFRTLVLLTIPDGGEKMKLFIVSCCFYLCFVSIS